MHKKNQCSIKQKATTRNLSEARGQKLRTRGHFEAVRVFNTLIHVLSNRQGVLRFDMLIGVKLLVQRLCLKETTHVGFLSSL